MNPSSSTTQRLSATLAAQLRFAPVARELRRCAFTPCVVSDGAGLGFLAFPEASPHILPETAQAGGRWPGLVSDLVNKDRAACQASEGRSPAHTLLPTLAATERAYRAQVRPQSGRLHFACPWWRRPRSRDLPSQPRLSGTRTEPLCPGTLGAHSYPRRRANERRERRWRFSLAA